MENETFGTRKKCPTVSFRPIPGSRDLKLERQDVAECHKCDIARPIHKLIRWNGLDLELQSNVIHFYEKRFLLCHFETRRSDERTLTHLMRTRVGRIALCTRLTLAARLVGRSLPFAAFAGATGCNIPACCKKCCIRLHSVA